MIFDFIAYRISPARLMNIELVHQVRPVGVHRTCAQVKLTAISLCSIPRIKPEDLDLPFGGF